MRKLLVSLAGLVMVIAGAFVSAAPADAATYKWANTGVTLGSLYVYHCAGGGSTIRAIGSTGTDVCGFKWVQGTHVYAYVAETGTTLFRGWNCGSTKKQTFNSNTDSSRHVVVRVSGGTCA